MMSSLWRKVFKLAINEGRGNAVKGEGGSGEEQSGSRRVFARIFRDDRCKAASK